MSAPKISPPCSESGWLDLLTETLHKILNSAGEAGSHLFDALWPHVQWAWNAVKDLVIKHPQIMVAVVILLLGVLLIQPLARGVVQALGFGGSGVRAMSIASQIQASLYGGYVPKGSLFSFLQSFGAL
ncbi:hypothetical protein EV363DRAFT_1182471 [Boletus edulis]|uniref:Uncharacterized protein n=1 Tax=Boletus edulis BED1 TaxID=1328754 RepID=A0AAD4BEU0_BOLED|nr:hypothetical protein EV363DRAFT_1182471 [Boletus edulis]KAF8425757.1 hypothetical protein L210DRAFT_3653138 [Boletus edulis BED1]